MEQTIDTLKEAVSQDHDKTPLSDAPQLDRTVDVFENNTEATTVIRKDVAHVGGEVKMVRRVFLRLSHSEDYRNIGWVLDADLDNCMLCGVDFGLFNRRSHCRVCGDLVCRACCSAVVRLKELPAWGFVGCCDFCFYGQEEVAVKFPQSTHVLHQKIQRIQQLDMIGTDDGTSLISTASSSSSFSSTSSVEKKDLLRSQLQQQETAALIRSEQRNSNDLRIAREKAEQNELEARLQSAKNEKVEQEAAAAAAAKVKAEQEAAAKAKAEQEAAAKVKAEKDEAARIMAAEESIALAEQESAFRLKAARAGRDAEASRVKAEQETAARVKAAAQQEEEAAAAAAAIAKNKVKNEDQRRAFHLKLAQEAARVRVNMEATEQRQDQNQRHRQGNEQVISDNTPFAVLKLRDSKENKIFVNVCTSDEIQQHQGGEIFIVDRSSPRRVQDKNGGGDSLTFDVCVHADSVADEIKENDTFTALVTYLNDNLDGSLSGEYSLPKIKGKFKGDHTPVFHIIVNTSVTSYSSSSSYPSSTSHDTSLSPSLSPSVSVSASDEISESKHIPEILQDGRSDVAQDRDRDRDSQGEKEKEEGEEAVFSGTPFAVMKMRDLSQDLESNKVFVNVCCVQDSSSPSLENQQVVIGDHCPMTVEDKKGGISTTYDMCVNSVMLDSVVQQEQIFPALIAHLNEHMSCDLSSEYSLPKIKSKFKGEHTACFSAVNKKTLLMLSTHVFDGSKPPERYFGAVKRQEGTLLKSFKQRYFLLQSGVLMVYKTEDDFKDDKEDVELIALKATFSVCDVNSKGKSVPELSFCVLDSEDLKFEILLQFENETDCQHWRHHFKQNLAYVEYKAAHLLY